MASNQPHTTCDHDVIRNWVESRNGKPSRVVGTGNHEDTGLLRIDFPGYAGTGELEQISWDDFFRKFEDEDLAFVYQENTEHGDTSNFNKIVRR